MAQNNVEQHQSVISNSFIPSQAVTDDLVSTITNTGIEATLTEDSWDLAAEMLPVWPPASFFSQFDMTTTPSGPVSEYDCTEFLPMIYDDEGTASKSIDNPFDDFVIFAQRATDECSSYTESFLEENKFSSEFDAYINFERDCESCFAGAPSVTTEMCEQGVFDPDTSPNIGDETSTGSQQVINLVDSDSEDEVILILKSRKLMKRSRRTFLTEIQSIEDDPFSDDCDAYNSKLTGVDGLYDDGTPFVDLTGVDRVEDAYIKEGGKRRKLCS